MRRAWEVKVSHIYRADNRAAEYLASIEHKMFLVGV
ncbi:hypothetical protein LINPERPRIM_LOCUS1629 [Linum perenne]